MVGGPFLGEQTEIETIRIPSAEYRVANATVSMAAYVPRAPTLWNSYNILRARERRLLSDSTRKSKHNLTLFST